MKQSTILAKKIEDLKVKAQGAENLEDLKVIENDIELSTAKLKLALESEAAAAIEPAAAITPIIPGVDPKNDNELYSNAFYNALKGKATGEQIELLEAQAVLSSGTGEDGGYLIPIDQRTAIKELKRQYTSLEQFVNIENVSTLTGNRNIEKDAENTPFVEFAEGDDVPAEASPQFVNISYTVKDRGGILPIPNNLLKDNTANLRTYLNKWLAKKSIATRNSLILAVLNTISKTALADYKAIKTALNVTLDPAISDMSIIIMNQDAFNHYDQLVAVEDGKPLLQPYLADPTKKMLFGKQVYVLSNKILKTTGTTTLLAPVIIGSLKEAITLFDREATSLLATNIGGGSFAGNRTDIRAITREDVQKVDLSALVYGQVDVTPA